MSKIKNVIFDIGGVLVDFEWDKFVEKTLTNSDEKTIFEVNEAIWNDGRWDKLDRGDDPKIVIEDMINHANEHEKEIRYIFENIGGCVAYRSTTIPWLKDLKNRGVKIFYLSNYSHFIMDANPKVLDFLPLMDGGVFSCDVHLLKPEREIYACIAEKYKLIPDECVFIDDLPQNIRGAENFGFKGIVFKTLEQVKHDLNLIL